MITLLSAPLQASNLQGEIRLQGEIIKLCSEKGLVCILRDLKTKQSHFIVLIQNIFSELCMLIS